MSTIPDSDVISRAKEKQKELLELYEKTRLKKNITLAIPTIDAEVRNQLRAYSEPICLFGEDAFDRRERLKIIVGTRREKPEFMQEDEKEAMEQTEVFYTYGSTELLNARKKILEDSLTRSRHRLEAERSMNGSSSSVYWDSMDIVSTSQVGDTRPLTAIAICPFSPTVAVAGWSGDINVFSSGTTQQLVSLKGHEDRCCSVAWTSGSDRGVHLVSGGVDQKIRLWNLGKGRTSYQVSVLEGHEMRINRVAVHPHLNQFIASTSDDETWRLWDMEKGRELLLQEGHSAEVLGLAIHPDGSLISTSDTGGVIHVWDLRTGKSILGLDRSHVEQVIGLDFSPNGYSLASCAGDNSVRIFDLRKKENVHILTAHTKLVSSVKFGGQRGDVLMSSGYDCVARIWRTSDFKIVKNLPLHETRIMAADLSSDGRIIATACYDRTFKIWSNPTQGVKMEIV
jgi:U4/U6 small nuclear ribonucleoprotein PRP4